jgi:hypothetical protein
MATTDRWHASATRRVRRADQSLLSSGLAKSRARPLDRHNARWNSATSSGIASRCASLRWAKCDLSAGSLAPYSSGSFPKKLRPQADVQPSVPRWRAR